MIFLAYKYLFGMRVCPSCLEFNGDVGAACQDLYGSNAMAEGGIFGRVDMGFTSIEAQKSTGSLHAHSQLFIQYLHQHTLKSIRHRSCVKIAKKSQTHLCNTKSTCVGKCMLR